MIAKLCMNQRAVVLLSCLALAILHGSVNTVQAQQLEPRAYSPAPVGVNFFGMAYFYSSGGWALDPSVPITNVTARIQSAVPFYGRTFEFFGRLANVGVAVPFAHADMHGDVNDQARSIDRTGFGDPAFRFAVNLIGLPALKPKEFFERKPETTLGASLVVVAPFGQYDQAKLINLGANRWVFKPELGISHPMGSWDLELYAGAWLFMANDEYYGGTVRRQDPLVYAQAHVIYTVLPRLWLALDYTYYEGGTSRVNGQYKNDRQDNSRTGVTLAVPVTMQQSLKFSWTHGVSIRIGDAYDTIGVAWQYVWF
jgi:hypothetical protein